MEAIARGVMFEAPFDGVAISSCELPLIIGELQNRGTKRARHLAKRLDETFFRAAALKYDPERDHRRLAANDI